LPECDGLRQDGRVAFRRLIAGFIELALTRSTFAQVSRS